MPKVSKVDWAAAQADRDKGISVVELCKKYGVSNPTFYTHTKANGAKPAGGGAKNAYSQKNWRREAAELGDFGCAHRAA